MFTADNYECTWDLFKSIPSLHNKGKTVYEETVEFNSKYQSHSRARLIDSRRAIVDVMQVDRLLDLHHASRIDQVEAALSVLDRRLEVRVA